MSRLSVSPSKKRSQTPEKGLRSRSKSRGRDEKQEKRKSFSFRSRSKSRDARDSKKKDKDKRSAEVVVSKEKLAENDRKMNEAADRDEIVSKTSAKSRRSGKKESTFEKLRREREERREQEMKNNHLEDSDVEIISSTNSDDMSGVTDPTYMTREKRKGRSREETEALEEDYDDSISRSISPSTRATNKSSASRSTKSSKKSTKSSKSKKENLVATIDPFTKATPSSSDPFDQPFYPEASNSHDEPQQMYSFVYSESDAELERGGMSKDTMTGLSFDSEDDVNNMDGLSLATPAHSDTTEVIKNNTATAMNSPRKQLLPPSANFTPKVLPQRKLPVGSKIRNSFLGIDASGAVTLNDEGVEMVEEELFDEVYEEEEVQPKATSALSRKAVDRSKRRLEIEEEKARKTASVTQKARDRLYPRQLNRGASNQVVVDMNDDYQEAVSLYYSSNGRSRSESPDRRLVSQTPGFIAARRERKVKEQEDNFLEQRKAERREQSRKAYHNRERSLSPAKEHRIKSTDPVARGRRRDNLFEKSSKQKHSSPRTFSPEKLKLALGNGKDVETVKLALSPKRSPSKELNRTMKGPQSPRYSEKGHYWHQRPEYNTLANRRSFASQPQRSSSRTKFEAPAVFSQSPGSQPYKSPSYYDRRTDPVLASVAHIDDPIQRAGAMVLSAAAIPIQTEMRRFLAVRHREDRAWGIVVIQSYFRRWKAELTRYKYLYCATRIQAAFRGWLVRDTLADKKYCATQIQRIARGYLATMKVYEDLYHITVVQTIARRNIAIKEATMRYNAICSIQAFWRGKQVRRELSYLHWSATKIQTAFRSYTAKLNYQFDVVDIIIVQSIARMRAAMKLRELMHQKKLHDAATVIQKSWRSYDSTMNYLHTVADILIVQSVVRRWIATRFVSEYRADIHEEMSLRIQMCVRSWLAKTRVKKQRAARDIQKVWRGFWGYTDYVFTLADIIIAQKTVRGFIARKKVAKMRSDRTELIRYNAATMIQSNWRRYTAQMEMLFNLVHIIIVQSIVRRKIALIKYKPRVLEYRAARTIQTAWRTYTRKKYFMENYCATIIQSRVRRNQAIELKKIMLAARVIQAWYRCQATSRGYLYYISARKIQTAWRGFDARKLADEERWVREYAATTIQKTWRMFYQYSSYAIYKHEKRAATDIQRAWRGFWDYSHFVIMRYEASKIQALVRGTQQRKRLAQQQEAIVYIQAGARQLLAKKTCHMERLFSAMVYSAQTSLAQKISAKKIQRAFRVYNEKVKRKRAALVIERFFIWVRAEVEREIERRERQRIKKRQDERRRKKENDHLLEDAYKVVNTPARTGSRGQQIRSNLQKSGGSSTYKGKVGTPSQLALDVEERSDVSGLTNPRFKVKSKGHHHDLDDQLEGAWNEVKTRHQSRGRSTQRRPSSRGSQKENSSVYTPDFKVSARSLSRNREHFRRATRS